MKPDKNDRNDAEAIREAVGRPPMRVVPPKSPEQLEIQAIHRIRQRLAGDRTRLVNRIRGLLTEHGIAIRRDIHHLRRALVQLAQGTCADDGRAELIRELSGEIREELAGLDRRIASCNRRIRILFRTNEACQRIGQIEGIGPITATALVAAAWLGLVPRQRSGGGKSRLFGISRRGGRYLRTLMIHGARAVPGKSRGKTDPGSRWIARLRERRHPNIVAVALASRNARIVCSVLANDEEYQPAQAAVTG